MLIDKSKKSQNCLKIIKKSHHETLKTVSLKGMKFD